MPRRVTFAGAVLTIAVCLASAAVAGVPTVIFSNIQTSPTSDVPGLVGAKFHTGTGSQFDRPFVSPDGSRWMFGAVSNLATTMDEVIIVGGGPNGTTSSVVVQEGKPTFFDEAVNWGTLRTNMGINNAGQWAFSADTSAATTSDEVAARWNGSGFDLMAREGTQAPGQPAGQGYGSTTNAVHILGNGDVRFRTGGLTGSTSTYVLYNNASIASGTVVAQTDVTIPGSQLVAPPQSLDMLTSDRFRSDADGSHYIYHGDLNGATATDVVMVYDGNVVAQEGALLPGSSFASTVLNASSDSGSQQISPYNGHYMFRGSNADTIDWVYGDGQVLAATDQPIFAGASELFDDTPYAACFFLNCVNSNGDYVIGGVTNAADLAKNAVLVYNNQFEFLREGDAVDVDGDGLFDDNAYISVFNNDDAFLTDDGRYFFNADLRDDAGTSIGQAYLWVYVPEPTALALLLVGAALLRKR